MLADDKASVHHVLMNLHNFVMPAQVSVTMHNSPFCCMAWIRGIYTTQQDYYYSNRVVAL